MYSSKDDNQLKTKEMSLNSAAAKLFQFLKQPKTGLQSTDGRGAKYLACSDSWHYYIMRAGKI